jgi:hypothetical protein
MRANACTEKVEMLECRAKDLAGIKAPGDLTLRWAVRVLDEYSVQNGKPGDRDVFVYREGFYRGCAIALFL